MHRTGVTSNEYVERFDERGEGEKRKAEKLSRAGAGRLEDPFDERAVRFRAGENDGRNLRQTIGELRELPGLPFLERAPRARMETDYRPLQALEVRRRAAPVLVGYEVVRTNRFRRNDRREERAHEIHVLLVPALLFIPPRAVREEIVAARIAIASAKLHPRERHQEEDADVSLEVDREVEGFSAERGPSASEARLRPPRRPGSVDDTHAVDEGESPGNGLVPASDGELDARVRKSLAQELERGKGGHEIAEAIEPQSEDALDASKVGKIARGPETRDPGRGAEDRVGSREEEALSRIVDSRPAVGEPMRGELPRRSEERIQISLPRFSS